MRGLTKEEVEERISKGLVNKTGKKLFKTKQEIILSHTLTYFNLLNLFLAGLILVTGQIKNMAFMGVVILNSLIGIAQELKVKKLVDQLTVLTASKANVIRDGKETEIPTEQVVQDDIVLLANGEQLCADCEVISSSGMEVNESMLTGESKPVKKRQGDRLMSGSYLVAGTGIGVVTQVGEDSYAAKLTKKAKSKRRATSQMQNTLKRIIQVISILILPVGLLLFFSQYHSEGVTRNSAIAGTVAGVIGMIPEGLVLLTSISFILGVGRLAKRRALVQEMEAIEALARVNVLCLDKTGTITTGELEVVEVLGWGETSQAQVKAIMNELAFAFQDINGTQEALMNYFNPVKQWKIANVIPFSSERKYRAVEFEETGSFALGAPEFLCREDLELQKTAARYSEQGYRVLLLGKCRHILIEEGLLEGTEPIGLIIISDCIRPEAPEILNYFKEQNVAVKIISGDNPETVAQIAKKAGLESADQYIDVSALPEEAAVWEQAAEQYTIFGRVKPEQKQRLIQSYRKQDKVVGMVGDGVNDVLALKDADCGIAMAAGSDAAKQVSHIVLLDSDFACLKNIVREGRTIISNIERVSALYLTKTMYSVLLCVIFILLKEPYPFIPIQLSFIGVLCIGFPSFVLTLEHNETAVSKGFLPHVIQAALPGALTLVSALLLIQGMAHFLKWEDPLIFTLNLISAGAAGCMVVFRVCQPLNQRRQVLCLVVITFFLAGVLLFPGFLSIGSLFHNRHTLVAVPLIFLVILFYRLLSQLVRHCCQKAGIL